MGEPPKQLLSQIQQNLTTFHNLWKVTFPPKQSPPFPQTSLKSRLSRQTGFRLRQDYALVQLEHLYSFSKTLLDCIFRQKNGTDIFEDCCL